MFSCLAVAIMLALSTLPKTDSQQNQDKVELALVQLGQTTVPHHHHNNTYIIAAGGNVTFKCQAHSPYFSGTPLHWNADIGNATFRSKTIFELNHSSEKFSIPPLQATTDENKNPAYLTIHNIQLFENDSDITCEVPQFLRGVPAVSSRTVRLLIEAYPTCPSEILITEDSSDSSLRIQWDMYQGLLPATYTISILANGTTLLRNTTDSPVLKVSKGIFFNATTGTDMPLNLTILLVVCTTFGCADNCTRSPYVIQSEREDPTRNMLPTSHTSALSPAIISAIAMIGLLTILTLLTVVMIGCIIYRRHSLHRRQRKKPTNTAVVEVCPNEPQEPQYATVYDTYSTDSSISHQHYTISQNCKNSNDNLFSSSKTDDGSRKGTHFYENAVTLQLITGPSRIDDSTSKSNETVPAPTAGSHRLFYTREMAHRDGDADSDQQFRKSSSSLDASIRSTNVLPRMNGPQYATLQPFTLDTA